MNIKEEEIKILKKFGERIDPKDPSSHNNLAIVFFNRGLVEDAILELKKALEINPDFKIAQRNLIIILKRTGKLEDYIEKPLREVMQDPENVKLRIKLAEAYSHIGRYAEAMAEYKNVIVKDPNNIQALKGLGTIKKKMGLLQEALATFKKAYKINPEDEEVLRSIGEIYYNMGLYEIAIKYLKNAIKINPESAEAHLFLSFALGEMGLIEEALDEAIKAKELNPYIADIRGLIEIEDEKISAEEELKEAMGIKVKEKILTFQSRLEMAQVYKNKLLLKDALRELNKALEEKPFDREALKLKAEIEILEENYDEAFSTLEKINPKDFHTWNMMACVLLLKGFKERAKKIWENILNYPYALNNYALLFIGSEEKEAEILLKKAYEMEEGFLIPLYNLSLLKMLQGKKEEAEKNLAEMTELYYTDPVIIYNYAKILIEKERILEAEKMVKNALEVFPDNFLLISCMKKIYSIKGEKEKIEEMENIKPKKMEKGEVFLLAIAGSPRGIPYFPEGLIKKEEIKDLKIKIERAKKYMEENNYEEAQKVLEEVKKIYPENFEVNYLLGEIYYKLGFYEAAENIFINLRKKIHDSRIILKLAEIYTKIGRLKEAEKELEEIKEGGIFYYEKLLLLSEIKEKNEEYTEALKIISKLFEFKKDDTKVLLKFGKLLLKTKRFEDAKKTFLKILEKEPFNKIAEYYLAKVYLHTNELDKAKELCEKLLIKEKQNPYAFLLKGEILIKEGKYKEALSYLEESIKINLWFSIAHYYMGILYALEGKYEEAIHHWEKVIKMEPNTKIGKKAREYIKTTLSFLNLLKKDIE
ncbi:MAG: tetratricopeptide repeat protein [candidate division WOR-3 bacterium]